MCMVTTFQPTNSSCLPQAARQLLAMPLPLYKPNVQLPSKKKLSMLMLHTSFGPGLPVVAVKSVYQRENGLHSPGKSLTSKL